MTPRTFLQKYQYDERLVTGAFFSAEPLTVKQGDKVGIVLLNLGGPDTVEDVAPFLYNLFMDPVIIDIPVHRRVRHWLCQFIAQWRSKSVGKDYEVIGGGSPINRLTREQASSLERLLNERFGASAGVTFKTYIAMRYWHPFSEEAATEMRADEIDKVVLLPLFPQYSKTTTGSSLMYWWMLEQQGELEARPTTFVFEYAANPKYVQAVSERIDQALQRFPRHQRDAVHLLFSAHGTPLKEMKERRDPYCCLIHATVDRIMALRQNDRPYHIAFQSKVGPSEWLTPSTPEKLKELAQNGHGAVLIVPVAFVTDHIETSYELDIEVREEAELAGIHHYEVMPALNCHPLFIEALAEATAAQLVFADASEPQAVSRNGMTTSYPLRPIQEQPRFHPSERCARCHQCAFITEAHRWTVDDASVPAKPHRPRANA